MFKKSLNGGRAMRAYSSALYAMYFKTKLFTLYRACVFSSCLLVPKAPTAPMARNMLRSPKGENGAAAAAAATLILKARSFGPIKPNPSQYSCPPAYGFVASRAICVVPTVACKQNVYCCPLVMARGVPSVSVVYAPLTSPGVAGLVSGSA